MALALALVGPGCGEDPPDDTPPRPPASNQLRFEGLALQGGDPSDEGITVQIHAGTFAWRKRRYGFLSFAPFREVIMGDVRVELRLPPAPVDQPIDPLWVTEQLFGIPPIEGLPGVVTQVISEPLDLAIEDEAGRLFTLRAERARAPWGKQRIDLAGLTLTSRAGSRLEAARGRWSGPDSTLWVSAGFALLRGPEVNASRSARFQLDRSGALRLAPAPGDQGR